MRLNFRLLESIRKPDAGVCVRARALTKTQHADKVEDGQVPFLPFISSSSVLLQLSVEPCGRDKQGRRRRREIVKVEEKNSRLTGRLVFFLKESLLFWWLGSFWKLGS